MQETKRGRLRHFAFWIVLLILGFSLLGNISRMINANQRIYEAKDKVERLKEENQKLEKEVAKVESDYFKEKIAREKLGLAKEGETVLVLPSEDKLKEVAPQISEVEEPPLPDPNWRKWLNLLI